VTDKYALISVMSKSRVLDRAFTYALDAKNAAVGMRAIVPFGKSDTPREGYIMGFTDETTADGRQLKSVLSLPDDFPSLDGRMLNLVGWMNDKYFATTADCIKTVLPPAVKTRSRPVEYRASGDVPPVLNAEQANAFTFVKKKWIRATTSRR